MWRRVTTLDDLWRGEIRSVSVAGQRLLLANIDGALRAFEDRCLHQAVPLSRGCLRGAVLTCSAHAWQYDLLTGRGVNPAGISLRALPIEARDDGTIWIDVGEGAEGVVPRTAGGRDGGR